MKDEQEQKLLNLVNIFIKFDDLNNKVKDYKKELKLIFDILEDIKNSLEYFQVDNKNKKMKIIEEQQEALDYILKKKYNNKYE